MRADEAIILVGGLGTRLSSVVSDVPKPLAPVAGRPFLAWVLDHLSENKIRHVVLAAGHRADQVQHAVGPMWRRMLISYSIESRALGTGGAVRLARDKLRGDAAHVLNGDTYLRYSLDALGAATLAAGADLGVALAQVPDVGRYGAVESDGPLITGFLEKGGSGAGSINAGCYFLGSAALAALPSEEAFSFEHALLAPMVAQRKVCGFHDTSAFIDIGVPDDYMRAQTLFDHPACRR